MSVYEGLKDILKVIQKADNIDLISKVVDVQKEALDLIEEIGKLKKEIEELRKGKDLESEFEYPVGKDYIIHKGTKICKTCWLSDRRYQVLNHSGWSDGMKHCPKCKTNYLG